MIAFLIGIATMAQSGTPPPPLPYATKSFGALAFSCSIDRGKGSKDQFSGHFGSLVASIEHPASPAKVEFVVDADTTQHLFGSQDAISVDGYHYSSFVGWPEMWRLVFSFGKLDGSGVGTGTVKIDSFTRATLNSTEQWQCSSERHAGVGQ